MTVSFNSSQVVAKIREVAAAAPGEKNATDCQYFDDDGACSCIVGHALALLGVTRDMLATEWYDFNDDAFSFMLDDFEFKGRPPIATSLVEVEAFDMRWIAHAQKHADNGGTWGDSVLHADLVTTPIAQ